MSELRLNLISREWVVVMTDRPRDPAEFRQKAVNRKHNSHGTESCPFCPEHESKTPGELLRHPEEGPWRLRVIPNKFSHVVAEGQRLRYNEGMKHAVSGVGLHEVIIEGQNHEATLSRMTDQEIREILEVYRERFQNAFLDKRIQHVIIYKNHGQDSGATINHPHSMLIGVPIVPLQIRFRVDEAMRFFDNTGQCLMCATLKDELEAKVRVLVEGEHFVSFVPYAALSPFHMWIFPRRHMPSFGNISDEECLDLARTLRATLRKLDLALDVPSYNLIIRSLSPFRSRSEYIHWYVSIVPRIYSTSGFEFGTGMHVNVTIPEQVAEYLKGFKAD